MAGPHRFPSPPPVSSAGSSLMVRSFGRETRRGCPAGRTMSRMRRTSICLAVPTARPSPTCSGLRRWQPASSVGRNHCNSDLSSPPPQRTRKGSPLRPMIWRTIGCPNPTPWTSIWMRRITGVRVPRRSMRSKLGPSKSRGRKRLEAKSAREGTRLRLAESFMP